MKTVQQLLDGVAVVDVNVMLLKRKGERVPEVLDGLKSKRPPSREGVHLFSPQELLTLCVDETRVNGRVLGYQRDFNLPHARKGARYLREGRPVPTLEIGLDGRGRMYLDDGQHRAAAAVMARVPLWGHVRKRDAAERAELFSSQRQAKRINPNTLVLSGDGPYERYVQEAVATDDPKHPWHGLVSPSPTAKSRIGPYALYTFLIRYVGNVEGQGSGKRGHIMNDRWDRGLADEAAGLLRCFGNKATHPLAFRPVAQSSIAASAMWVFRRRDRLPDDYARWQSHMPKFPFDLWPHLRREREITAQLLTHWNKGLRGSRRINRPA